MYLLYRSFDTPIWILECHFDKVRVCAPLVISTQLVSSGESFLGKPLNFLNCKIKCKRIPYNLLYNIAVKVKIYLLNTLYRSCHVVGVLSMLAVIFILHCYYYTTYNLFTYLLNPSDCEFFIHIMHSYELAYFQYEHCIRY